MFRMQAKPERIMQVRVIKFCSWSKSKPQTNQSFLARSDLLSPGPLWIPNFDLDRDSKKDFQRSSLQEYYIHLVGTTERSALKKIWLFLSSDNLAANIHLISDCMLLGVTPRCKATALSSIIILGIHQASQLDCHQLLFPGLSHSSAFKHKSSKKMQHWRFVFFHCWHVVKHSLLLWANGMLQNLIYFPSSPSSPDFDELWRFAIHLGYVVACLSGFQIDLDKEFKNHLWSALSLRNREFCKQCWWWLHVIETQDQFIFWTGAPLFFPLYTGFKLSKRGFSPLSVSPIWPTSTNVRFKMPSSPHSAASTSRQPLCSKNQWRWRLQEWLKFVGFWSKKLNINWNTRRVQMHTAEQPRRPEVSV